ncbi:MAG: Zn-dependent exopeptidase M28 [Lentisphaerae bacterium]|nr:Zn-dependent exopeptidase M28 [Lentisphaerota bacterium]MCP4099951.1 Zn-dependent exopeptidase M28 [Lentisphaerota bacterium]
MKNYLFNIIALILFFIAGFGCTKKDVVIPKFDENNSFKIAREIVAFGDRPSGSAGNFSQIEYIYELAGKYSAYCRKQSFSENTSAGTIKFVNIEAVIPGRSKEFLVIGCHFDTKRMPGNIEFQGANDGASGVAVALEIIRAIKQSGIQPYYSLHFVFFDGEECIEEYSATDGLFGSRYYAKQMAAAGINKNCRGVIILDMVGDKDLSVTLPSGTSDLMMKNITSAAAKHGLSDYFGKYHQDILDDHYPFQKLGIPVIDIIDFNFGPQNSFWHTSADNLNAISKKSLKIIGIVTLEMILNGKY